MSLQPITVIGFDNRGGLQTNKKPVWIPETAFQTLENAYAWRDQVKKREGLELVGRLTRVLSAQSLGMTAAGTTVTINNIFTTVGITGENPELIPGTLIITVGAPDNATFTDLGNGNFSVTGAGVAAGSYVDYATGMVVLQFTALAGGASITASLSYAPTLPVMGIQTRVLALLNVEQTIFFDTKYAYIYNGTTFQEFIPGTTWAGTNSDFFWTTNYRGILPQTRLFFATNFVNDVADPIRYTDGVTWTNFSPMVDSVNFLTQARILIPYFGRLLALNVWEGPTVGTAANIFNRCRFSAVGDPTAANAWRTDIFGQGGLVDAPTNENIVGATFLNNTLIVFFEKTTWQLRYVGEYGTPFIFERIASDLGSDSTFSTVLFNSSILAVGNRAIISADSNTVSRIDLEIPDQIFQFQNMNNGVERVQGVRDYQKELVYWCYADAQTQASPSGGATTFPNKVLVYNYRNNTWAIYRENVTAFGTLQFSDNITWDNTNIFWQDELTTWDDFDTQSEFPYVVSGNQEGFIHLFGYTTATEAALSVTAITFGVNVLQLTINNHNLATGDSIYLTNLQFIDSTTSLPVATDLNNNIYLASVVDANNINIARWNFVTKQYEFNFSFVPAALTGVTYVGGGQIALLFNPMIQTKDFNPFQTAGLQSKLSYVDFLLDTTSEPTTGNIFGATNASPCVINSPDHGLQSGQQVTIAQVAGMTQLNVGAPYTILVIDEDNFSIGIDSTNYTPYIGNGVWTLVLADLSVQIFMNSSLSIDGNLFSNQQISAYGVLPFYGSGSQYQWHRFYATCAGQYMNFLLTYDPSLMNVYESHENELVLNALVVWVRKGGRLNF